MEETIIYTDEEMDIALRVNSLYFTEKENLELLKTEITEEQYKENKRTMFSKAYTAVTGSFQRNGQFSRISALCTKLSKEKKEKESVKQKTVTRESVDLFSAVGIDI